MTDTIQGFCVCDEEMCFCPTIVDIPITGGDVACSKCAQGFHVWGPGEPRDTVQR